MDSTPLIPVDPNVTASSPVQARALRSLPRGTAFGRYVLVEQIGEGGMGVVYAAYDPELDRKVAVKLLQSDGTSESDGALLGEAKAMARLTHPNVLTVHDVGSTPQGVFIAMELVRGTTLRGWLEKSPQPTVRERVQMMALAGEGLAAAHRAGLVHRDFKPDNVLVDEAGRVLVMDFGLARANDVADAGANPQPPLLEGAANTKSEPMLSTRTQAGFARGTPAYMAPEQFAGSPATAASDQFSFAVSLYQVLYGVRPFLGRMGAPVSWTWQIPEAPRDSKVPVHLRKLLLRALSRRPEDRFPSMEALLAALRDDPRARRRRRLGWAGFALALLATVIGLRIAFVRREGLCSGGPQLMAGVWDDGRRAQLKSQMEGARDALSLENFAHLASALDKFRGQWLTMHEDACRATRIRGEQSDAILTLRMTCLDQRRRELKSLVDVVAQRGGTLGAKAAEAANSLADVATCADLAVLQNPVTPPPASQRVEVEGLRERLGEARTELLVGGTQSSAAKARSVLEAALRLGYRPLQAEALLVEGMSGNWEGNDRLGILRRAMNIAYSVGNDSLAVEAAGELILNIANGDDSNAQDTIDAAEAIALRAHSEGFQRAALSSSESFYFLVRGQNDEAVKVAHDALATLNSARDAPELQRSRLLGRIGAALTGSAATMNEGRALMRESREIRTRLVGERTLAVALQLLNEGEASNEMMEYEEGAEESAAAAATFSVLEATLMPSCITHGNEGDALYALGRVNEALEVTFKAVDECRRWKDKSRHLANRLVSLSTKLMLEDRRGELEAALAELKSFIHELSPTDEERLLGEVLIAAATRSHDPSAGLALADRREQALRKSNPPDLEGSLALLEYLRARILLGAGQVARARPHAQESARLYGLRKQPHSRSRVVAWWSASAPGTASSL